MWAFYNYFFPQESFSIIAYLELGHTSMAVGMGSVGVFSWSIVNKNWAHNIITRKAPNLFLKWRTRIDSTCYLADRILIDARFAGLPVLLYYIRSFSPLDVGFAGLPVFLYYSRSFSPLDPTTIIELGHHVPRGLRQLERKDSLCEVNLTTDKVKVNF